MLKIEHKSEPNFFIKSKKKAKNWSDIQEIRFKLREHILQEQKSMCAYCEKFISANKEKSNIDHFKTRNLFPNLVFEYKNLFISCNSLNQCSNHKDNLGLNKIEMDNLISPLEINLLDVEYISGKMYGKNENIRKLIKVLNLNNKSLIEIRKNILLNLQYVDNFSVYELVRNFKGYLTYFQFLQK